MVDLTPPPPPPQDFADEEVLKNISDIDKELKKGKDLVIDLDEIPDNPKEEKKLMNKVKTQVMKQKVSWGIKEAIGSIRREENISSEYGYKKPSFKEKVLGMLGKEYINVFMRRPSGKWVKMQKSITEDGNIKYRKGLYRVLPDCIENFLKLPTIFYFEDNPNPVDFDQSIGQNTVLVSAKSLHDMFQRNFVKDLFSVGTPINKVMLTAGIIIAFAIGIVIVMTVGGDQLKVLMGG